ncbi:alpha/beta hydrolase [Nocardia pseudobrasiliensis]|uniref:Alpha-beta hydrolase superfamily lysophospholipase n=1 Tax=Nocardia pseudobrasiliensis TaxID=45979 RepID=A0A370I7A4_9NOCA|nr:alpha/beta hydrolase [Nocardia pseudobrasiliensis]RDI65214.1 alpha-beta hydrolase superfamily lysophospholipase [Nocardia pseudobrasiliensis]
MSGTETGGFEGRAGRIFWRAWLPDGAVRGVVALVHGVAEHSGRYEYVGRWLADAGFAVYAPDHIGHGRSAGGKSNIESIDGAADNVMTLLESASAKHPGVPRFIVAHSMGSLITLRLATRAALDVAGIAVSAPPLVIEAGNAVQRLAAPILSRWTPNLGVLRLDSATISRDPEVVRAYDTDPLVFRGALPARTANEMLRNAEAVTRNLNRLTVPTLVMHGTGDQLASPASTDLIERDAAAKDLTVRRYEGLYHEIFNEPERDVVLTDLVEWLEKHLGDN